MAKRKQAVTALLDHRIDSLRERLGDAKADALLVTNPRDIRYLTGFVGDDSWALITLNGTRVPRPIILSDFRFEEQIAREAPHAKTVMRKKGLVEELRKLGERAKLGRIALQPAYVNLALRKRLVKEMGAKRFVEVEDDLLKQRSVKSADEVAAIRAALKVHQQALRETVESMKPGQTEVEVAAFFEYHLRSLGADGTSFPTIVAADANASLPHAIPGQARMKKGGIVLIDCGGRWGGYCSDLTRVYAFGKMPAKMREVYLVVLDAQLKAIDAIKPGASLKDVDSVARKHIQKAGYGKRFGHSLGHGIGLDIHEQPTLSQRSEGVLEPGQVVTVEPGVYLPGVGGVRIEDDVLVTDNGGEVLSDLPKDLRSAII
jgi:Xaa-Pro aminopeptidase